MAVRRVHGVVVSGQEAKYVTVSADCFEVRNSQHEKFRGEFAERAHGQPQTLLENLPEPPASREFFIPTAPDQTSWEDFVVSHGPPVVSTMSSPCVSEASAIAT